MIEPNTFICADCLDVLRDMPDNSVDMCLTDPPYGMNRFETDTKDYLEIIKPIFPEIARVLRGGGSMFCCTSTAEVIKVANCIPLDFKRLLWLYKPNDCTFPFYGWLLKSEAILWFSKGKPNLIERKPYRHDCYLHTGVGQEGVEGHPTVKPLAIFQDFVLRSNPGDIILDPFCGSGTTAIACHRTGRRFICIDKEPKYIEIAKRRYAEAVAQGNLFDKPVPDPVQEKLL